MALVIADGGEKYLNTIFNEEWLKERIFSEQVWGQLDSWFALSSVEEGE